MCLAAALISAIVFSSAHIAMVDGAATIARDGRVMPATVDAPFVPGDRLQTTAGRVEVIFPDGTLLDVDEQSVVDLESPTVLHVIMGRVHLIVSPDADPASAGRYRIIEDQPPVVDDQPTVVQVYGGAQVISERCSLVTAAPSLAEIARRQPHRRASTRTIVMTGSAERPPAVPTRAPRPPVPVAAPHSTGAIVTTFRAQAVATPQQVQPDAVPTPSYVVALPRVKVAPPHDAPSHTAPSHPAPQAAPSQAATPAVAGASKMTSSHATRRP